MSRPLSEADENAFSDRLPAFLVSMGTPEIGRVDCTKILLHRIAQHPLVEKIARLVQQIMLLDHVLGFEHGSRKPPGETSATQAVATIRSSTT